MTVIHTIPTIDISPYLDSTSGAEARAEVIQEVSLACSTYGFLQVKGQYVYWRARPLTETIANPLALLYQWRTRWDAEEYVAMLQIAIRPAIRTERVSVTQK